MSEQTATHFWASRALSKISFSWFPAGIVHNYHSYLHLHFRSFPIAGRALIVYRSQSSLPEGRDSSACNTWAAASPSFSAQRQTTTLHSTSPMLLPTTGTPSPDTALRMVLNNSLYLDEVVITHIILWQCTIRSNTPIWHKGGVRGSQICDMITRSCVDLCVSLNILL